MMNNMGNLGWGMGFGWLFMILFWGLIILGIVAFVKWLAGSRSRNNRGHHKTALEVLEERYARGEIGREEFERKKRDLQT